MCCKALVCVLRGAVVNFSVPSIFLGNIPMLLPAILFKPLRVVVISLIKPSPQISLLPSRWTVCPSRKCSCPFCSGANFEVSCVARVRGKSFLPFG